MDALGLIGRELLHRWMSAILSTLVVGAAVAWVLLSLLSARANEKQTRIIQRDMGLNLVILSDQTDEAEYWERGYSDHSIPEEYIDRVHDQEVANRLIPLLKQRVQVQGQSALLIGISAERFKGGKSMKPVFGRIVEQDQATVGGALARILSVGPGSQIEVLGRELVVGQVLREAGTAEDMSVYVGLDQAQEWLGMLGRINEIQALECHCTAEDPDPAATLSAGLERLLPGTRVVRRREAADARRRQRILAEEAMAASAPLTLTLAGMLLVALALLNSRARLGEMGVLVALGHGPFRVAGVLLGRAFIVGLAGTALGCWWGPWLAGLNGLEVFPAAALELGLDADLATAALVAGPLFSGLATLPAIVLCLAQDPIRSLGHG